MSPEPRPTRDRLLLRTVGHSVLTTFALVATLRDAGVEAVADIRSVPASRAAPQHDREVIAAALSEHGIGYVFLGDLLGGRPPSPDYLREDRRVDYAAMARRPAFTRGLTRLLDGAARFEVAIMCAEADPAGCHRRLLVGRALAEPVGRSLLEAAGFAAARLEHLRADREPWVEHVDDLVPAPDLFGQREWCGARPVPD